LIRETGACLALPPIRGVHQVNVTGKRKTLSSVFTDLCAAAHGLPQGPVVESVLRGGFQRLVLRCGEISVVLNTTHATMRRPALGQDFRPNVTA
jgi:hypothetical protein